MSDNNDDFDLLISTVHRREAQSGRVSYGNPEIIYESNKKRMQLIPFYIKRTDGTEIAARIDVYEKSARGRLLNKHNPLHLNQSAIVELVASLRQQLSVAVHRDNGHYITIKVLDGVADVANLDSATVAKAVAGLLSKNDIVKHLNTKELGSELVAAFRGAIRLQELRSALATLCEYLNSGVAEEEKYQEWCEQHTWAFGNAYCVRDDVRSISAGDELDLLLPTLAAGYRDLIELKRPDKGVLRYDKSRHNYYFSSDVSMAIGQCHRYLDVLHEETAKGLRDHPEIVAYHPRATIVIGRSNDWSIDELRALHGLNRRLNGITVMTYDQLLAQGERLVQVLGAEATDSSVETEETETPVDEDIPDEDTSNDDDIPF